MNDEDLLREVTAKGTLKALVVYSGIEISLYWYKGQSIEIWFNLDPEKILKIQYIDKIKINPFLKFLENKFRDN